MVPSAREIFFVICLVSGLLHAVSVDAGCVQLDACSCRDTESGRLISLHALANIHGDAAFTVGDPDTPKYTYRFNPCFNLSKQGEGNCQNVALCQTDTNKELNYNLGKHQTAVFNESKEGFLTISFVGQEVVGWGHHRVSTVYLACDLEGPADSSKFAFVREPTLGEYTFVLTSRCACPGGCSGPFPAFEKIQSTVECQPDKHHSCGCRLAENNRLLSISTEPLNIDKPSQNVVANTSKIFFNQCGQVHVPAKVCEDSAVCLQTEDGDFQDFGQVSSLQFVAAKMRSSVQPNVTVHLTSADGRRQSNVRLVCDRRHRRSLPPKIIVRELTASDIVLEARSECACSGRCEKSTSRLEKIANETAEKGNHE